MSREQAARYGGAFAGNAAREDAPLLYYCSLLLIFTTDMAAHLQEAQREKTQLSDKLSDVLALLQVLDLLALLVQKCKY